MIKIKLSLISALIVLFSYGNENTTVTSKNILEGVLPGTKWTRLEKETGYLTFMTANLLHFELALLKNDKYRTVMLLDKTVPPGQGIEIMFYKFEDDKLIFLYEHNGGYEVDSTHLIKVSEDNNTITITDIENKKSVNYIKKVD